MTLEYLLPREVVIENTRSLYSHYLKSEDFKSVFEKLFGISYKLIYGSIPEEVALLQLLGQYYRNEYYVKHSFVSKCLNGQATSYELTVGESRADIVGVHRGHSCCYEIKTEYDTLERLPKQISDYSRCFEYCYVVCSDDKVSAVEKLIPDFWGVYSYKRRSNCAYKLIKKARQSNELDSTAILSSMTKKQLKSYFGDDDRNDLATRCSVEEIGKAFRASILGQL